MVWSVQITVKESSLLTIRRDFFCLVLRGKFFSSKQRVFVYICYCFPVDVGMGIVLRFLVDSNLQNEKCIYNKVDDSELNHQAHCRAGKRSCWQPDFRFICETKTLRIWLADYKLKFELNLIRLISANQLHWFSFFAIRTSSHYTK